MRERSVAIVVRDGKLLMIQTTWFNRPLWEVPGGGIEPGETPAEAALRELQEEAGVTGTILRPLNVLHRKNGNVEHVFLVDIPKDQEPIAGIDPELAPGKPQNIKNAGWKSLEELSEGSRAFLWSYGLMDVDDFFDTVVSWGDEISFPGHKNP